MSATTYNVMFRASDEDRVMYETNLPRDQALLMAANLMRARADDVGALIAVGRPQHVQLFAASVEELRGGGTGWVLHEVGSVRVRDLIGRRK